MTLTISRYGVTLRRVGEGDIEMIRRWRNDPSVAQYMHFRDHITPQMQREWFASIDNEDNYFFIIEYAARPVGMIDIKRIDRARRTSEGGIFLWDAECLGSDVALRASMTLIEFGHETLGLEGGEARILRSNRRAIDYNRLLGYELARGQDDEEHQRWVMTWANYEKRRANLLRLINE